MNLRVDAEGHAVRAGEQTEIGGNDRYIALCRRHFMERLKEAERGSCRWAGGRRRRGADARLAGDRQAGRSRLDPDRLARSSGRCARAAIRSSRSATAAPSTRWRAASCRWRSARRPSSPAGCSMPTRPTISRSGSARRRTRSMRKGGGGAVRRSADAKAGRGGAAALHRRDRAGAAGLFGAEGGREAGLRPGSGGARRAGEDGGAQGSSRGGSSSSRSRSAGMIGMRSPSRAPSPRAPTSARSPATSRGPWKRVGHVTMLRRTRPARSPSKRRFRWTSWPKLAKARTLEQALLPLTAGLDDIPALPVTPDQARALRRGAGSCRDRRKAGAPSCDRRVCSGCARGACRRPSGWCAASTFERRKE
jgi:hypothetical protein